MTTCPKCQYERQPGDAGPDYECPKCGIVYAKYKAPRELTDDELRQQHNRRVSMGAAARVEAPNPVAAAPAPMQGGTPQATAKPRPELKAYGVIMLVLAAVAVFATRSPTPTTPSAPRQVVYNSGWDGSVSQVEQYLKRILKDPDSFDAIEWSTVVKTPTGYMVRVKYRAKNSFGGYVIEERIATLDEAGRVISMQ